MIFIWSGSRVVYANRQCELSMGYSREEFYAEGYRFQSLIEPGSLPLVETNLRRHLAGADVPPYEYSLITREGRRIDAILTSKLIRYEGEPAVLGISTDITMRTRAERLLLSLNEAALAMEQALAPSEIFPLAARMLSSLGIDSVVFLADAGDSRGLCAHCWGDSATGEVSLEHGGEAASPLFRIDAVPTVAAAMDSRRPVHAALDSSMLASMHAGSPAPAWVGRFSRWPSAIIAPLCVGDENFGLLAVAGKEVAA
jgi:PAS domain S-box-containing protein